MMRLNPMTARVKAQVRPIQKANGASPGYRLGVGERLQCFHPRPCVRGQNLFQAGMGDHLVTRHCLGDNAADLLETDLVLAKCVHGHFIGGIEDCGQCPAHFAGLPR